MAAPVQVTEQELQRLVKLLGLLGSSAVGERAAAALKAHEWVQSRGLGWSDVLFPPPDQESVAVTVGGVAPEPAPMPQAPPPPPPWAPPRPPWAPLIEAFQAQFPHMLRGSKEQDFVQAQLSRSLAYGLRTTLSDKQEAWLRDILARAGLTW